MSTTEKVIKAIDRIRELAPKLNKLTNEAVEIVVDVEKLLNVEASVGLVANVKVGNPEEVEGRYLTYRRFGSKFRIGIIEKNTAGIVEFSKPYSDCKRDEKLEVLSLIPKLIEALVEEVNNKLEESEETVREISSVLEILRKKETVNGSSC